MNHNFYFDGRQIKNYLVGFASLFSEIPYKTRRGKLESVPIHYGSPSDIISHLEMNVDNDETKNRNRLKDVSVPLFSFRMTAMEKNLEKRRAPLDSITVDLRPLGYSTGYVAMKPAPVRFTFELVCWASSDYQAFEITEQIIPYFNSPQQVNIEPLPRCPVSTTEVFLESVEIDTEPESQKYSAMITMSFSLTGWLLTQPRIWSTNMKFEFQMLDKDYSGPDTPVNLDDTDWSIGHEIIDTNDIKPTLLPTEDKLASRDSFIKNTKLAGIYGEKLDIYNELLKAGRISNIGQIVDTTPLEIVYKDKPMTIELPMMELLVDDMEDVEFLFTNELLMKALKGHSMRDNIDVYKKLVDDLTDILDVFLTLLDNNLTTKGFNRNETPFSNSDKLNMFGNTRIDIDGKLERLRYYLAALENIKVSRDPLLSMGIMDEEVKVYLFGLEDIPFEDFSDEYKEVNGVNLENTLKTVGYLDATVENGKLKIKALGTDENMKNISIVQGHETVKTSTKEISYNLDGTFYVYLEDFDMNTPSVFMVTDDDKPSFNPIGAMVVSTEDYPELDELTLVMNGKEFKITDLGYKENIHRIFDPKRYLNDRFINLDDYVISTLLLVQLEKDSEDKGYTLFDAWNNSKNAKIYQNKYNGTFEHMLGHYGQLTATIEKIESNIDKIEPVGVSAGDVAQNQANIAPDLAQSMALDNNGKPIYDVNGDGKINQEDLRILGSEVDNPEDFDHVLRYGIWYKAFHPDKVSEERVKRIMQDLKLLFYLTEKTDLSEVKDFVVLTEKELVTPTYDLYEEDEYKMKEVKALGYDTQKLDDKLLFMRMFVESVKNIIVKERDFIVHFVPDMNEESKRMLYMEEGLDIDRIAMGKFIDQYLLNSKDSDQRIEDMALFRKVLPRAMGDYINYAYQFDIFMQDIKKTELFIDSMEANTPWLSENLPEVEKIIQKKYLTNK